MTKANGCGTGPEQPLPARAQKTIGGPHGETGSSASAMIGASRLVEVEGATMPTVSEPLPTLLSQPQYGLLKGGWDGAMTIPAAALRAMANHISASLNPASPATALALIERLARHYPRQPRNEREAEMYFDDWADDVADIPGDVLAAACAQYRRSEARFMATPGQIRALAEPILSFRQRLHRRAHDLIAAKGERPARTQKPEPVKVEPDPSIADGLAKLRADLAQQKAMPK